MLRLCSGTKLVGAAVVTQSEGLEIFGLSRKFEKLVAEYSQILGEVGLIFEYDIVPKTRS